MTTETTEQAIDRVLSQWDDGIIDDIPDLRKCLLEVLPAGPSISTIEREIKRTVRQWIMDDGSNGIDGDDHNLLTRLVETYFELQQGRME